MKQILTPIFLFISILCYSTNWLVGPSRSYTKPSQVAMLVQNGDTVSIDAATYTADVCRWAANNLLLRGVGGKAKLDANNTSYGRKAIWVIAGNDARVEYIEFLNCHDVPGLDLNWAGIRSEGINLSIRHCYFHDNDNGILGGVAGSRILIEFTEFNHNGYGDGYSHNLYISHIDSLIFRYNYSHHAAIGHELKSRADVNYILFNRISNESTGDASRNIDLPNGGMAIIMGNVIEQGPNSGNSNLVGYGLEGLTNAAPHNLHFVNNTLVNDKGSGTFVSLQSGTGIFKGYNNIFAGPGTLLSGTATTVDTAANWRMNSIAACGFVNAGSYDYHLTAASAGTINTGTNAGAASNGHNLTPALEYVHPANQSVRGTSGAIDRGAYEFIATGIALEDQIDFSCFISDRILHLAYNSAGEAGMRIIDLTGRNLFEGKVKRGSSEIPLSQFESGIYILDIISVEGRRSEVFYLH